jgi:hypothetical protein
MINDWLLLDVPWLLAWEGEGGKEGDGGKEGGKEDGKKGDGGKESDKAFSQDDVNKMLADDRRKHQQQTQKAVDELKAIQAKLDLSNQERGELDERVEQLNATLLSKEELSKREQAKIENDYKKQIDDKTKEATKWRNLFTESTIVRAITDAAVEYKAFAPEQIVALLRPKSQLVDVLNADSKPTGELTPKIKFDDVDDKGKPVTLDLTVTEAVKRMSELDRYLNLFKVDGEGGVGAVTRKSASGKIDVAALAKDPVKYRQAKKDGLIP